MVSIRTEEELIAMKRVGRVVALALRAMREGLQPGMSTAEVARIGAQVLDVHGARSAPRETYGFPGDACISVNDEIVHGIPGDRLLQEGDLVKLDITAELNGYIADSAITLPLSPVSRREHELCHTAKVALRKALGVARAGQPVSTIGRVVEQEVRRQGFAVVRELCGHGLGRSIHEEPQVPNYYEPRQKDRLTEGLVIAVEPMIAIGNGRAVMDEDGWTVRTEDGGRAAHYEHTIVVMRGQPLVLTAV
jgi:methionyl aminopeptidase